MMRRAVWMALMGMLLLAAVPMPAYARLGKVGLVTTGSLRDHGFNYLAWEGMQSAKKDGLVGEIAYREPDPDRHITAEQNLKEFLADADCSLLIVSGYELGKATVEAARSRPNQKIAIVDFDPSSAGDLPNLMGLTYQSDEPSFLAGYVAAAVSTSGAIGTFGGLKMPPVIQFMEGFEMGMLHYNRRHSKHIRLKGWSTRKQTGLFTGSFENIPAGYGMASRLYDRGADIVFPVAGMSSYGAVYRAVTSPKLTDLVIGVDVDFNKVLRNTPGARSALLTSVLKKVDVAVKNAIAMTDRGEFKGGLYLGTLENGGVGIAPFHGLSGWVQKFNPNIETEIREITRAIVEGCLPTRRGDVRNPACK